MVLGVSVIDMFHCIIIIYNIKAFYKQKFPYNSDFFCLLYNYIATTINFAGIYINDRDNTFSIEKDLLKNFPAIHISISSRIAVFGFQITIPYSKISLTREK